jgi:hypothetical protein
MVMFALCGALSAHAEDRVIPASQEPRHVVKLENAVVRIIDVEIPPGYRTLMHEHANNYAYLMVSAARLRNEVPGKPPADMDIPAGLVGYYRASEGAYVHRFTNIGETQFRAIGIELLSLAAAPEITTPRDLLSGYVTVLDNERVRAYRLVLQPGQSTGLVRVAPRTVRVAETAGSLTERSAEGSTRELKLAPAQFEWRSDAAAMALTNTGSSAVELYEFELK